MDEEFEEDGWMGQMKKVTSSSPSGDDEVSFILGSVKFRHHILR